MKTILFALALLPLSCGLFPVSTSASDYLPRETDVPGWVKASQSSVNDLKAIESINRAYSLYDPKMLSSADYHYLSDDTKKVRIEVLEFGSTLDSFGLYGNERDRNRPTEFSNDDDYTYGNGRYFRIGVFYVKITGENLGDQAAGVLDQYRAVLFENLRRRAGDGSLPDEMFLFAEDRSNRDIVFHKRGIQSIPGLENLYVMRRSMQEKKYNAFFIKLPSVFAAEREFYAILKSGGGSFVLSKAGNYSSALRIINEKEYLLVSFYKHWVFGVLDAETMKEGNNIIIALFNEIKVRAYALYNR